MGPKIFAHIGKMDCLYSPVSRLRLRCMAGGWGEDTTAEISTGTPASSSLQRMVRSRYQSSGKKVDQTAYPWSPRLILR